jgi:hypothetical protein
MTRLPLGMIVVTVFCSITSIATRGSGKEATDLLVEWDMASKRLVTADVTMLVLRDYGVGGSLTLEQLDGLVERSFERGGQADFELLFAAVVELTGNSPTVGEVRLRFDGENSIREDRAGNHSTVVNDGRLQELSQQGSMVVDQSYSDSRRSIEGQDLFRFSMLGLEFEKIMHHESDGRFAAIECGVTDDLSVRFYYTTPTSRLRRIEGKLNGLDFQRTWCSEEVVDASTQIPRCRLNAIITDNQVEALTGYVIKEHTFNVPLSDSIFQLDADRRVVVAAEELHASSAAKPTYWLIALNVIGVFLVVVWYVRRKG